MKSTAAIDESRSQGLLDDVLVLVKARLSFLVLITTLVGFLLGWRGPLNWLLLGATLLGTALCASGAAALNQWWERDGDAKMKRTSSRPVPAGRIMPNDALMFGLFFSIVGIAMLALFRKPTEAQLAAAV